GEGGAVAGQGEKRPQGDAQRTPALKIVSSASLWVSQQTTFLVPSSRCRRYSKRARRPWRFARRASRLCPTRTLRYACFCSSQKRPPSWLTYSSSQIARDWADRSRRKRSALSPVIGRAPGAGSD